MFYIFLVCHEGHFLPGLNVNFFLFLICASLAFFSYILKYLHLGPSFILIQSERSHSYSQKIRTLRHFVFLLFFLKKHLGSGLFSVYKNKYENLILEKSPFPLLLTFQIQSSFKNIIRISLG